MATLDKTSIRNEISRLKADFEQLRDDGKVPKETWVLMNSVFMMMELMLSIFLERTTKKESRNSSKPSSQTEKDDSSLSHPGSNGKGKDEKDAQAKNRRVKETVTLSKVSVCDVCGEVLRNIPCHHIERRTKIDIVFEKVVTHVDAEVKLCPTCDSTVKGSFPADMPGPYPKRFAGQALAIRRGFESVCHQSAGLPDGGDQPGAGAGEFNDRGDAL